MDTLFNNPRLQKIWNIMPEARLVGGCVRDFFLGQNPKDIDLAVPFIPQDVCETFKKAGFPVIETGLQHGTVTVMVDGEGFELTTLRSDVETDGRHAQVKWVTECDTYKSLLTEFIDKGYNLDQDYSFEELLEVLRSINQ